MGKAKQQGFNVAILAVGLVIMAVAVVVVWRVWDSVQLSTKMAQVGTKPVPAPDAQKTTEDPNKDYVVLPDWRVRFKPTQALGTVQYAKLKLDPYDMYTFSTVEFAAKEPSCSATTAGVAFGSLTRTAQEQTVDPQSGIILATINGYRYQYRHTDGLCSKNKADEELEGNLIDALGKSLDTLEAAK